MPFANKRKIDKTWISYFLDKNNESLYSFELERREREREREDYTGKCIIPKWFDY